MAHSQHECSRRAGDRLGRGGWAVSAMVTAANFRTGGIVRMGVPKPIVFRWITLMNFKCIYFHQYSDLQKFKHNSSIRKTIWNPMVILLMPTIEFLTEKNCFKVQNHRFSMEKWFCRARTIVTRNNIKQMAGLVPLVCT